MKPLSFDLRQRIAQAVDEGQSQNAAAKRFGVSAKTVGRLLQHRRETGTLCTKPRLGRAPDIPPERYEVVARQMRAHPDASLEDQVALWQSEQGQTVSYTTFWRTLKRMKWSHKKRV